MKKIITMIGTSLFENYKLKNDDSEFKRYLDDLKKKDLNENNIDSLKINYIKEKINKWFKSMSINNKANVCAEIKSLVKIKEELDDIIEIYFLTSDTILSRLVYDIISEIWSQIENLKNYKINKCDIKNLQVNDRKRFNDGMINLIYKIYNIANDHWDNLIINISAGYKATLPFLTILAQVNKCPLYYIFEDIDALIKIPYVPLSINWQVFEQNEKFFYDLEIKDVLELPYNLMLKSEVESLIEKVDNLIVLNPLGITLWEKYKEKYKKFDVFYISEIANKYFEEKKDRQPLIKKSLQELKRRLKENPQNPDLRHLIKDFNHSEDFYTFKHKENNLQVRILYKAKEYKTRYGSDEKIIYIGLIAVGSDVHNSESEYLRLWKNYSQKLSDIKSYLIFKIEKRRL